ncbi:cytochrome p450 [Hirsutella rhossiliensis]|uniref:Cytochrome p450 domain-containing protein n=1 Tax=Hirsutella rhossiliensis TaxID=111463 RepID=A0A9P8SIT0_9HYPO|nr:cytochrome p450 domain-containing protein [Hirsutella rhossiliensis]KAH0962331.1 cytochrome p450 domain-containing protein [Hirsutella rhossiliensis]
MATIPLWPAGLAVAALLVLYRVLYNVFLHPLRKFPGPLLAGATSGWKAYKEVIKRETLAQELFDLHRRYGDIVRIAPNELHFGNPGAFHDIYHGSKRWDKDPGLYRTPGVKTGSFVFLKYSQAKERREVLLPIFSKKAIQSLEHLVWQNATRLASSIARADATQSSIDLLYAFRSYTLDTIMCFTFGNCVNALAAPAFRDPLILAMDASLPMLPVLKNFPLIRNLIYAVPPSLVMRVLPDAERLAPRLYQVRDLIQQQLRVVLQCPSKLDDASHQTIFHRMLDPQAYRSKAVPNMTALHDEGFTLIFAGANTVADTLLMGHWHTMQNPDLVARLRRELVPVWPDLDTPPSLKDLEALPLLTATIKESLRFIPSGVSLTRIVPPGGATIAGQQIPGGAAVGMAILHVHQSAEVWGDDVLDFRPERWLEGRDQAEAGEQGTPGHRKDLDHWLVPFSRGPRMCFGVNLAWAELYIAFATMIRRFDLAIDGTTPEDMEWRECIAAYYPRRHLHAWCHPVRS